MSSEKTEAPTPRRLARAREKGDFAASAALSQAIAFVVALLMARGALGTLTEQTTRDLGRAFARAGEAGARAGPAGAGALGAMADAAMSLAANVALTVVAIAAPLLLAVAVTSVATTLVQTGGAFAPGRAVPELARLDLVAGFQSLFHGQRIWSIVRSCAAASLVGWLACRALAIFAPAVSRTIGRADAALAVAARAGMYVAGWAAAIGLALGSIDWLVTKRAWLSRLRMTKAEAKREVRESEGDPKLKSARQRAYQEMLASAVLHAVRDATVVIVNPEHLATALRYRRDEDEAPRVVAAGQGDGARRIQEAARAYGVPVVRDVPVARALRELEIGDEIPEALYEAVAEILREIWEADPGDEAGSAPREGVGV